MAALVRIEHELRPTRQELAAHRMVVVTLDGYPAITELHKVAADLVATIVHFDQDALQALKEAEIARRFAADTLNTAGTTLAAYRRVVAPPVRAAGLVDRRG